MDCLLVDPETGIKEQRLKFVASIARGKPVLNINIFIDACNDANEFVPFESSLLTDDHVSFALSEATQRQKEGCFLSGYMVYLDSKVASCDGLPDKENIRYFVNVTGATLAHAPDMRRAFGNKEDAYKAIIITGNVDKLAGTVAKLIPKGAFVMDGATFLDTLKVQIPPALTTPELFKLEDSDLDSDLEPEPVPTPTPEPNSDSETESESKSEPRSKPKSKMSSFASAPQASPEKKKLPELHLKTPNEEIMGAIATKTVVLANFDILTNPERLTTSGSYERIPLGTFEVYLNAPYPEVHAQYVTHSGVTIFQAEVPPTEEAHMVIQGNADQPILVWDAFNERFEEGGVWKTRFRRYFFPFERESQLTIVLDRMFRGDFYLAAIQFFKDEGKFVAKGYNLPGHDMAVAVDSNVLIRPTPLSFHNATAKYDDDNVYAYSQQY